MKNSYDNRIVNYENMQGLTIDDFNNMVFALDPQSGESILDVGAGYGAATREILIRNKEKYIHYVLLEKSKVQLERAKSELEKIVSSNFLKEQMQFVNSSLQEYNFMPNSFNKVIAKAFIHEIPENEKEYCFQSIYDMLKPGGKFIVWNIVLDDFNKGFYRSVIRKKDAIGGFDSLVKDRHFLTEKGLENALLKAGFSSVTESHSFEYKNQSAMRLSEFDNDTNKLLEYHQFIIDQSKSLDDSTKAHINLKIEDENVIFSVKQGIYIATK